MGIWITAAILLALAVLPLGVRIRYNEAGFVLKVIAGPLKITVFPREKKTKKQKTKPQKREQKVVQPAQSSENLESPPQPPKAQPEKKEKGGSLTRFLPLVKLGLKFLGSFRRKLRLDNLYLRLILAGDDPCDLAVNYGRSWAAVGNLMPQLERLMRIPDPRLHVEVDFDASELRLTGDVGVTLQIRDLLAIGFAFAKPVLRWYLAMQKRHSAQEKAQAKENGAAPKEHDTADRTPSGDGADHITT